MSNFSSCKKDKLIKDSGAKVEFSQDSVLFDTVFTSIGSATRNIRVRNKNKQRINISSIQLQGGASSQFMLNVDGAKGTSFSDVEIAANDSMYIFIQVNVNPNGGTSPLIISDAVNFVVNGNEQKLILEAWGQDAYYHRPDSVIKFSDGTYFPYSLSSAVPSSYTKIGDEFVWKNDKPHVVYGYLVVDEYQKLRIQEGTKVYMNYKSGIWVYAGGQIQVLGKKDNEVIFQAARREKTLAGTLAGIDVDYTKEPGQWDRIWINEGSTKNIIDYAIIKNAYIGVQCEYIGDEPEYRADSLKLLTLTNTKIQNMSMWGLYCLYFNVIAHNNVISDCQENSVNIMLGGSYLFAHNTFANYWSKDKPREKTTFNVNNYSTTQVLPLNLRMANCIVDGKLDNELNIDVKTDNALPAGAISYTFSNNWLKTNRDISDATVFINNTKGSKDDLLKYKDVAVYNFEPLATETRITNFTHPLATLYANLFSPPKDINGKTRNTVNVTVGAYETQ